MHPSSPMDHEAVAYSKVVSRSATVAGFNKEIREVDKLTVLERTRIR